MASWYKLGNAWTLGRKYKKGAWAKIYKKKDVYYLCCSTGKLHMLELESETLWEAQKEALDKTIKAIHSRVDELQTILKVIEPLNET